jgi:hypothetical protein
MNELLFDLQNPVFDITIWSVYKKHNSTPRQQTAEPT